MATVSSPLITMVEESLEDILSSSIVKWINSTDFDLESTCVSTEVYSSFSQDSNSSLCCNGWNYAWLDEECIAVFFAIQVASLDILKFLELLESAEDAFFNWLHIVLTVETIVILIINW